MTRFYFAMGLLSLSLLQTGCTTCRHQALECSRVVGSCESDHCPSTRQRDHVHIFLLNGDDLLGLGHLEKLRDALNSAGYSKVYYGQIFHGASFEKEARQIRCLDPDARFVFIGYGLGAGTADGLAARLGTDGLPVDGLVGLAPLYLPMSPLEGSMPVLRRLMLYSHAVTPPLWPENVEVISMSGVGQYSLPTHPGTVDLLVKLLHSSAIQVPEYASPNPSLLLLDEPAPLPSLPSAGDAPEPKSMPSPGAPRSTAPGTLTTRERDSTK